MIASAGFSPWLALVGLPLLVANGSFTAIEIALVASSRSKLEEQSAGNRGAAAALRALDELPVTFSGTQLGITLTSLGLGALTEPAVAGVLEQLLGDLLPDSLGTVLGVVVGLGVVAVIHLVLGEMMPKNVALARPESVALTLAQPFRWFAQAFRPVTLGLNAVAGVVSRAIGIDPSIGKSGHSPEELLLVVHEASRAGDLPRVEARAMGTALRLNDLDARDVMTPRNELDTVPLTMRRDDILAVSLKCGHSRLPVLGDGPDDVRGIVHVKDLLVREPQYATAETSLRTLRAIPETMKLRDLLAMMLGEHDHAALVIDEYGGTAGLVTLEDVLEEFIGEIEDEFDRDNQGPVEHQTRIVGGRLRLDEVARRTDLQLQAGENETLSGWMTERVGRLLEKGDIVMTDDGWRLFVLSMDGQRAGEVEIRPPSEGQDG